MCTFISCERGNFKANQLLVFKCVSIFFLEGGGRARWVSFRQCGYCFFSNTTLPLHLHVLVCCVYIYIYIHVCVSIYLFKTSLFCFYFGCWWGGRITPVYLYDNWSIWIHSCEITSATNQLMATSQFWIAIPIISLIFIIYW